MPCCHPGGFRGSLSSDHLGEVALYRTACLGALGPSPFKGEPAGGERSGPECGHVKKVLPESGFSEF